MSTCVGYHNQKLKTAGLMMDKLDITRIGENAETWEKVVRKVPPDICVPSRERKAKKRRVRTRSSRL